MQTQNQLGFVIVANRTGADGKNAGVIPSSYVPYPVAPGPYGTPYGHDGGLYAPGYGGDRAQRKAAN